MEVGGPRALAMMNKREENLGGCNCTTRTSLASTTTSHLKSASMLTNHSTLDLSIFVGEQDEPVSLKVRDCVTVTQLKYLIEKETGMTAEQQMLYNIVKGRSSVPMVGTRRLRDYCLEKDDAIVVEGGLIGGSFCICFIPCPPPCCKKKKGKGKDGDDDDDNKRKDNYYPS